VAWQIHPIKNLSIPFRIGKDFAPTIPEIREDYIRQNTGSLYRVERIKAAKRISRFAAKCQRQAHR
jgi:hypothetical protein